MSTTAEPPPSRRRRRWLIPVLIAVAVLGLVGGGAVVFVALRNPEQVRDAINPPRPLRAAKGACGNVGEIADGDRTLFLDMQGKDANSGRLDVNDLTCVLGQLKTPTYVIREMEQTRALDGRQSETWESFEASWTYHPDQGLDVLIREK